MILSEGSRGFGLPVADLNGLVDPAFLGPDEEGADRMAGGGPGGEVFVDVLLGTGRRGAVMGVVQPRQEFDRLGDLLFSRAFRAFWQLSKCAAWEIIPHPRTPIRTGSGLCFICFDQATSNPHDP